MGYKVWVHHHTYGSKVIDSDDLDKYTKEGWEDRLWKCKNVATSTTKAKSPKSSRKAKPKK